MSTLPYRLLIRWLVGVCVGTLLIAITSPWFVRSYLPPHADSVRGVWTLPPESEYRWRSEGYADSHIGEFGMPGKPAIDLAVDASANPEQIALWGDSQAEGVCLPDTEKLFSQLERESEGRFNVLPFARSGDDAADWVTQMPAVEQSLGVDQHVILVVELADLQTAMQAPIPPPGDADAVAANGAIAARLPAFVIQSARHLLTEDDGATRRQLRFGLGPVASEQAMPTGVSSELAAAPGLKSETESVVNWHTPLSAIRAASELPITLLYAPLAPHIIDGRVRWEDPQADEFQAMQSAASELGFDVVDARQAMRDSAQLRGQWPHGFHNGQFGVGHLNRVGNTVLAAELVDALLSNRESRN
ncbi:MAG: hypothetical protein ACR2NZ_11740 [Rubripirellula sp.]